ncbi:MAG: hypothetical protein RLZZ241_2404 [Bacteroidota bacterium]|jgi:hypothetical protein
MVHISFSQRQLSPYYALLTTPLKAKRGPQHIIIA